MGLVLLKKPKVPEAWDYTESVKKTKAVIYNWKGLTKELATELWVAREKLSKVGRNWNNSSDKTWAQYCEDIGSSKQVVNRWIKQWFTPELPHVSHSSGENEWYTPPVYAEAAREVMQTIDLDPASSEIANTTIKAKKIMTEEDNGLEQEWEGNVWLNPPYSQPLIDEFSEAVTKKYKDGEISQACILVNNATETRWFQRMLEISDAVCFIRGRVKFLDKQGEGTGAPLQGQAIIYLGNNPNKFSREFSKFGIILWRKEEK